MIGRIINTEHGPYRITGYAPWNRQYVELEAVEKPTGLAKFRTVRRAEQVEALLKDQTASAPVAGRFVLLHDVDGEEAYATSWDDWADAEASAWPLEPGWWFEDTHARMRLDAGATEWVPLQG